VKSQENKWIRPRRIIIKYTDPFDDTWLCSSNYCYDPRLSATGFYSHGIKIMRSGIKKIQSHILEGRTPKVSVEFIY